MLQKLCNLTLCLYCYIIYPRISASEFLTFNTVILLTQYVISGLKYYRDNVSMISEIATVNCINVRRYLSFRKQPDE